MDFDTRTYNSIEITISNLLDVDIKYLESYLLGNINFDSSNWYYVFVEFLKDKCNSKVDSCNSFIYFHTLTRRLNIDKSKKACNLRELLLSENEFTSFCNKYRITYKENKNIDIFLNGEKIDYSQDAYLMSRLVTSFGKEGPDICVNGFLIRENIKDCYPNYYNNLGQCPEFLKKLLSFLDLKEAINDYYKDSTYYIYTYRIPIKEIKLDYKYNEDDIIYYVIATMCLA